MMQDNYSGLSRTYSTAPVQAFQDIETRLNDIYAAVDVSTDALIKHAACSTSSAETILSRACGEVNQLQEELKTLIKQLQGAQDETA